ncbi:sensor domain-containing diguanylate cyclase [Agaribacterium haliotis]|uniref:sensor domain-containing diguanylate cyclase n=1 Tax=Agaribacterium haliotis TaxID=2013869 RepID=UPI0013043E96|nr:sensor domain-containing diguanylate cyclase [Agaribacterium haliotis]
MRIATKIMLVVVMGMSLAVLLTIVALNYYERRAQEEQFYKQSRLLAEVVAQGATASVAFLDKRRAREELDPLRPINSIRYACLYSTQMQTVLAELSRGGADFHCDVRHTDFSLAETPTQLQILQPIRRNGLTVGALFLVTSNEELQRRRQQLIYMLLLAALSSCLVSLMLVNYFQRRISMPIVRLNAVTRAIASDKDWSQRVERYSEDELGELVDSFNGMVDQIEQDQRKLEQMAYYDALTKLPNRRLLEERLSRAIARARRNDSQYAVCFIDLDDFKWVNDTLGHDAGDLLLKHLAERVSAVLRKEDTLARFGGDEFVIVSENVQDKSHIGALCSKVLEAISQPMTLVDRQYQCRATIGVALGGAKNNSMITLMKQADIALYEAKKTGKNKYGIFDEKTHQATEQPG